MTSRIRRASLRIRWHPELLLARRVDRAEAGIAGSLVRLCVELEAVNEPIADLGQALIS